MRTQTLRVIAGRVNGSDGSIVAPSEAGLSSIRTSAGAFVVRLPASVRMLAVNTTALTNGTSTANVTGATGNSFNVGTFTTTTGAAIDASFLFQATVWA